jgi:hypothetical protein
MDARYWVDLYDIAKANKIKPPLGGWGRKSGGLLAVIPMRGSQQSQNKPFRVLVCFNFIPFRKQAFFGTLVKQTIPPCGGIYFGFAERGGFEPPVPF